MQHNALQPVLLALPLVAPLDPLLDLGMFVRAVVVEHQMQREVAWCLSIQLFKKGKPLLVGVTLGSLAEHLAVEVAQRGEQCERAVAHIVVGGVAHMAHANGQSGQGTLQRLALALLIAAEDQRPVWRIEIQPDNIPELGLKVLVVGEFEGALEVRFDVVGLPQSLNGVAADPFGTGHLAGGPLGVSWRRTRRLADDLRLDLRSDDGLASTSAGFAQASDSAQLEALLPVHHHGPVDSDLLGHSLLTEAVATQQHDACPPDFALTGAGFAQDAL